MDLQRAIKINNSRMPHFGAGLISIAIGFFISTIQLHGAQNVQAMVESQGKMPMKNNITPGEESHAHQNSVNPTDSGQLGSDIDQNSNGASTSSLSNGSFYSPIDTSLFDPSISRIHFIRNKDKPGTSQFEIRFSHSKADYEGSPSVINTVQFDWNKISKTGLLKWAIQGTVDPSDTHGTNVRNYPYIEFQFQALEFSPSWGNAGETNDSSENETKNLLGITIVPTVNWVRIFRNGVSESTVALGAEVKREWETEIQKSLELTIEAAVGIFGSRAFSELAEGNKGGLATSFDVGVELEKQFKHLLIGGEAQIGWATRPTGEKHFNREAEIWVDPGKEGGWFMGSSLSKIRIYHPLPGNSSERQVQFFVGFRKID